MSSRRRLLALVVLACLWMGVMCGCSLFAEYTVQFNCGSGAGDIPAQTVKAGQTAEPVQVPEQEGYVFEGWYQDAALTQPWNLETDKVSSNLTLYASWDRDTKDEISNVGNDKDFSTFKTPGSQEAAYDYRTFFRPSVDGIEQPYVGDPMPYYEDGIYYIYYLKDGGDSYNHSIYLTTTTDFLTYTEYDDPILEASRSGGQDGWIGTGSVVKVNGSYYFFYTGHSDSVTMEYKEKIMVAVGSTPTSFEKMEGWELTPPEELGQKTDFRDPQAYYDAQSGTITLTVTASQEGKARILKFTLSEDLQSVKYDGIIFTDEEGEFWNLECSDTFQIGDTWYLTYSAQDDTLWYATASTPYGPYGEPARLDGKLFYAAKHVENGENCYMVGWARRSESVSSTSDVSGWAGNLVVQKLVQNQNGSLVLTPVETLVESFSLRRPLSVKETHIALSSESLYSYQDVFHCYESFLLSGEFSYSGTGSFGLSFYYNDKDDKKKLISISPSDGKVQLQFNEGNTLIAETAVELMPGETYGFTYIQEGSVGVFYLDGKAALTVRLYGVSGKPIQLFAEQNEVLFTSLRQYTKP